jgi:hypothetical protein
LLRHCVPRNEILLNAFVLVYFVVDLKREIGKIIHIYIDM